MYNIDTCNAFTVWVPMEIDTSMRIKPQSRWKLYKNVKQNMNKAEKKQMIKEFYAKFPHIPFVRFWKIKNKEYFQVGCTSETTRNTALDDLPDWFKEENMDWTNAKSIKELQLTPTKVTCEKVKILKAREITCSDAKLAAFGITRSGWNKQIQQDEEDEVKRKKFSFTMDMDSKVHIIMDSKEADVPESVTSKIDAFEAMTYMDITVIEDTEDMGNKAKPTKEKFYLYNLYAWIGINDTMSVNKENEEKMFNEYGLIGMHSLGTISKDPSRKHRKMVVMEGEFKNAED
ncbi:hypothetical protein RclHR1_00990006 [Rhizophagus clarus]|uniref:Uncharacterized protein n=1 Tax=Rhizophagus clarus TaxID=94130 RepID=A0A2Z6SBN8_9GLOM|nr:hypothetical protein RclHR1_00990006 [Rhizophagus clarus]